MNIEGRSYETSRSRWMGLRCLLCLIFLLVGCTKEIRENSTGQITTTDSNQFLPVDCLLPPRIRKLGQKLTFLEQRRPIRTSGSDCAIRGGEYTAYDRADYRTALTVWLEQAAAGDAEAQNNVGEIYLRSVGSTPDYESAAQWFIKAADQGYSRAQINLGYLYEFGFGVPSDSIKALNLYRAASGLDEELAYWTDVDGRAEEMSRQQVQALEYEIQQLTAELRSTTAKVDRLAAEREVRQKQLDELGETIEELRRQGQATESQEQLYSEKQNEIKIIRQEIAEAEAQLQNVVERQKRAEATVETEEEPSAGEGPVIEILQPRIPQLRTGETVIKVRDGSDKQTIDGVVHAPGGIKQAHMNDQLLTLDENGRFSSTVAIELEPTPIIFRAVDLSGRVGELTVQLVPADDPRKIVRDERLTPLPKVVANDIDFGRYYALIFGNNRYQNFDDLQTAVADGSRIRDILEKRYGFDARLVVDADRYEMLSAIDQMKSILRPEDNLLIYYAGHGEIDPITNEGYWLPVDAEKDNTANWIPNNALSSLLNTLPARHVMVVADSCYSGSLTRNSIPRIELQLEQNQMKRWLEAMTVARSRTVLTSGGLEPVLDSDGGEHSVFASALIRELESGEGILDAFQLYLKIADEVKIRSSALEYPQTPTYAPIQNAGHGGGEFLLVGG